jgi:acetyl-CoA carboxylase carboxyltransferase component
MTPPGSGAPAVSPAALDPLGRMALLCDADSMQMLDGSNGAEPVGVVAAVGRIDGRPVVCYAHDWGIAGGSVGTAEADAVVRALKMAHEHSLPLVAFLESAGARLLEGAAALGGFSRIFFENVRLSRRAPQISVITGMSAGGGCYSPALTDFVVMTRPSAMFLTGPRVVREAIGEDISIEALGGPTVHNRNGVCQFVVDDDHAAAALVRDLLGYLAPALEAREDPPDDLDVPDPGRHLPASARKVYDVRHVVGDVVDDESFLEVSPRWARNMVVGFARLGGRRIGVVANQPRYLAGVIDVGASEKAARFVRTCDRFRLPLVVLVDTPGFMPGSGQESAGIIRHGAELVRAFAAATVPRFSVVLRKAYGGAYITMNSKDLGADLCLAWPGAEIGIMAGHAAVRIMHRRRLAEAPDPDRAAAELADEYDAGHVAVEHALQVGVVDEVISPVTTRGRLRRALAHAR